MADKACGQTTSIFMKPALSLRLAALVGIAVVIAALFPSTPILPSPTLLAWSCAQAGQALAPFSVPALARVEAWAWSRWERSVQQKHSAIPLPVLSPDSEPTLSSPFVLRGLLNASEAFASFATTEWLQRPPIGDIRIHYFSNASRKQLVTPDSTGRVADVVAAIARGGPQKIGTESVIRAFPELLRDLPLPPLLTKWFGSNEFLPHRVGRTLTVPIFLATGAPHAGLEARTELHAEPIGNVMLMLSGSKRWTLISPAESHLLRPTIAPDGRAYFLSALDADKPERLDHVRRWQGETNAGDVLWIPPWTWHRVSYVPNVTALSASLFHFRPRQFVCENSIFALLSIPNIFKELVGMKTQ